MLLLLLLLLLLLVAVVFGPDCKAAFVSFTGAIFMCGYVWFMQAPTAGSSECQAVTQRNVFLPVIPIAEGVVQQPDVRKVLSMCASELKAVSAARVAYQS